MTKVSQASASRLHRSNSTYRSTLNQQRETMVSRRVGGLYPLHQNKTFGVGEAEELFHIVRQQGKRRLTDYMLALFKSCFNMSVVVSSFGEDKYRIRFCKQLLIARVACLESVGGSVGVKETAHAHSVDIFDFRRMLNRFLSRTDKSNRNRFSIRPNLSRRDSLSSI